MVQWALVYISAHVNKKRINSPQWTCWIKEYGHFNFNRYCQIVHEEFTSLSVIISIWEWLYQHLFIKCVFTIFKAACWIGGLPSACILLPFSSTPSQHASLDTCSLLGWRATTVRQAWLHHPFSHRRFAFHSGRLTYDAWPSGLQCQVCLVKEFPSVLSPLRVQDALSNSIRCLEAENWKLTWNNESWHV